MHSFYNLKVRENKTQIRVTAHYLFGFGFCCLKGLRLGTWKTRDLTIGGKNLVNINFANIANQVNYIDTYKYYQQSLSVLVSTMTDEERFCVKKECKKFIENDPKLNVKFQKCSDVEKELILDYLSSGKGVISYEMITRFDLLDIAPANDTFFLPHHFYTIISREDYKAVKKLYCTMNLENLEELNKLYNFQDTVILTKIFEQRSLHLQKLFNFNPQNCNSASSFSGCVHRDKSKCLIALPTEA